LRNGSVSNTVRARAYDGSAAMRAAIAAAFAARTSGASESRAARTWRRSANFASRSAGPCGSASIGRVSLGIGRW
jgi:hypothetical protein